MYKKSLSKKNILQSIKFLKIRLHTYIDYLVSITLLALIWILGLQQEQQERPIIFIVAIALVLNNMITRHRLGLTELLCIKTHGKIDLVLAAFLGIQPLTYGTALHIQIGCLLLAIVITLNVLFTKIPKRELKGHDLI